MQGFLVVTFRDTFGQETTRRFELGDGAGITSDDRIVDLLTNAEALYAQIEAVTGADIVKVGLDVTDTEIAISVTPDSSSNISDDGVLSVQLLSTPAKKGTIRIPAPKAALLLPNGAPDYSGTSTAWLDLVEQFRVGESAQLSDGENVDPSVGMDGILKSWRASRGRRSE